MMGKHDLHRFGVNDRRIRCRRESKSMADESWVSRSARPTAVTPSGSAPFAMDYTFDHVCVLVTAAFALTLVPGLRQPERSLLSRRDQGTALLVFLVLGLVEDATFAHSRLLNERIVAVCAAGLLAGPWVGAAVGAWVTALAVGRHGLPLGSIAIAMLGGGLAGGGLYRWRPALAQHPLTGFGLTLGVSWLRNGLLFALAPHSPAALHRLEAVGLAPALQGLGTALILALVAQARDRDDQARAAAEAEARALQARMNPHFLFNALNALAALSRIAPREVPRAAGRLRQFLRASFDQHERLRVPLEEELAVVGAYLELEALRLEERLKVEEAIDPGLLKAFVPPFCLQPLVENAVQHGLHARPGAGRLQLVVRRVGGWLELSVSDNGQGVPSAQVEEVFFGARSRVHALGLLRRRLQGLFGRSFALAVRSELGAGTTVTLRLPLPKRDGVGSDWPRAVPSNPRELAPSD